MTEISGTDTWMMSPVGKGYEGKIKLRKSAFKKWSDWQNLFNNQGVALVPYCMNCTEVLIWELEGEIPVALKCENCQSQWELER